MSADNWTICPNCKQNLLDEKERKQNELNEKYGKISLDEYNLLQNEFELLNEKEMEYTLREDYQIGIKRENFNIEYRSRCSQCQFSFIYNHHVPKDELLK